MFNLSYVAQTVSPSLISEILFKQRIHCLHSQSGMKDGKHQIFSTQLLRWTGFMFHKRVYVHSRREDLETAGLHAGLHATHADRCVQLNMALLFCLRELGKIH